MKRKVRKFRLGGGTDETGSKASYEESPPELEAPKKSFAQAFREAEDGSTFEWNDKKYKKEYADKKGEKTSPRKMSADEFMSDYKRRQAEKEDEGEDEESPSKGPSSRRRRKEEAPGRRYSGVYGETREALASLSPEQKKDALKAGVVGAASMAGAGALGLESAAAGAGSRMMAGERGLEMARRMETAARMEKFRRQKEAAAGLSRGSVYKKGGSVRSSASKRADGIAQRGKTRGKMY